MRLLYITVVSILLVGCSDNHGQNTQNKNLHAQSYVTSLSISKSGEKILTAHAKNKLLLWDVKNKTKSTISNIANIFSAYYIKGHDIFLWQNVNDMVYLQDTQGNTIDSWHHFPTYGHIVSKDKKMYFSADKDWNIYYGYEKTLKPVKKDGTSPSFLGSGKLLNLQFSPDETLILSTGIGYEFDHKYPVNFRPPVIENKIFSKLGGVVLWDTTKLKPIKKITGNVVKTFATFSPDGKYVVSGDENRHRFVWDVEKNERKHWLADLTAGRITNREEHWEKWKRDKTGLIPAPKDMGGSATLAIKFVSAVHYLMFFYDNHYAALYHIDDDMPIKYFDLGKTPFPSTKEYYRNVSIDSAPDVGILVTGQHRGSGINVYKFDKEKLTLKKLWVTD